MVSASIVTMDDMEVVLRTRTPERSRAFSALVCAKILEEHSAVAGLDLIDRTIRNPMSAGPIRALAANGSSVVKVPSGFLP